MVEFFIVFFMVPLFLTAVAEVLIEMKRRRATKVLDTPKVSKYDGWDDEERGY